MAADTPAPSPEPMVAPDPVPSGEVATPTAPPLVLPEGMTMQVMCPNCGLLLAPAPDENIHGAKCPNCGSVLP